MTYRIMLLVELTTLSDMSDNLVLRIEYPYLSRAGVGDRLQIQTSSPRYFVQ